MITETVVTPESFLAAIQTPVRVMIAGSRYATPVMLDYAASVVSAIKQHQSSVVVGDADGVDKRVVQTCCGLSVPAVIVGLANLPRNGGCDKKGIVRYIKYLPDKYVVHKYSARDRHMVDIADVCVFIWNGESRGTKAGYDYAVSQKKPAHLISFAR